MHKNYFLEVISERPALFSAMLRFNGVAAAHDAQSPPDNVTKMFADLPRAFLNELWNHGPSRKHVQACIPFSGEPFWDFSEESRCLALLEPETLNELALFYGASLHAPAITRTIMGSDLALLREALGEHVHLYALQRGQYQMPTGRAEFTARHQEMPLAKRVMLHGKEALGIIVSAWPETLQKRISITSPSDMTVSAAMQQSLWFDMKKILIREVASVWAPYFA